MKKILSFMLAFVMMVTTFVGVFPPLEVSAATAASISSLKASPDEAYEGDSVQVKGTVKSGSYYLRAIQINVRNEGDDDHGFTVDRVDFDFSKKKTSYSLSNLDEIDIGSYTCSGCGRKESLDVGEHRIDVHVGLYDSNGDVAEGFTKSVWIEVLEEEPPYVKDIDAYVDGTEVEFTVKTNLTAKYGIVLYADGYKLDMIDWDKDTYSSYIKYTGSHVFNQVGERTITVYALDEDGDIVNDSDDSITVEIDSLGRVNPPSITTKDNQTIEVGNNFKVSWTKPSSPTGVTFKYNVYVWDGTNNTLVGENLTTTSCTIPANTLSKAGTYAISVIAMAKDYTQSDDDLATINLTVNEVQENPNLTSVNVTFNGAIATFTVKGNADAKYGIVLYTDGYKLDMINWSKSGTTTITYTGSHTFNQTGTRNIVVYALDKDGKEVTSSMVTTSGYIPFIGECRAPTITTANNQKIEAGNSFKISWTKPTWPTGVTFKYNVYVWDGTNNTLVGENLTTTSYTIPASKLSKAGTYAISVIAMATDYTQSDDDDATINLTVTEVQENPDLTSVSGKVNGTVATFTVKGNADAKYGIVLYADGYKLDMISWSKSGTSTVTYTGSHTFNQTGTRTIVVYALDKNGNEVSGSKVTTTVNITSLGVISAPSITTANNQKIEVGNSFKISWNKPTSPTGVTFKYNVYVWDGTNNTLVGENITATSYTIPASKLNKAGTYAISVIAMATDYTQSDDDDATINLTVTEVQENPDLTSVSGKVNGTVATFTVKGNADAKYGIVLYADGYKLDMISWSKSGTSTVTYTGSHTFNQTGTRNIVVYALDKNGNEVSGSKVTTTVNITSLGVISAPSITSANNQKIEVGNSFKISWNKPTSPTGVTFKYNVYVWDGASNVCVNASAITGTSYTIPASYFSKAGTYTISVIAMATDYTQSNDDDAAINLTVTEVKENPDLTSVSGKVNGTVATFTVKGNADAKYGIVLYADGYKLDMISWSKSGTSTVTYTGSHTFNQTGTRTIVVYALDKNGNEVSGSKVTTTVNITSLGVISAPSITTANNQKIEVGNSFKISWNKPTSPTGVTFKYNVYVWDGTNNTLVGENLTTTSYTIPANKLSKAGTYAISVIAMATDYTQSDDDDATINLTVTEVQENPDLTSVSGKVNGTVATFTVKGNADAKYGIVLYADGYKLDMISWSKSGSTTYTGSHTFNQTGERKITVYALDKNGKEVSDSKVTTTVNIVSLGQCGAPSITTSNNQKIEVGNGFTISWNKPTAPTGVTFKYNVYVWDGKTNACVNASPITGTSYTIPASCFAKAGTYTISVIAMATNYTQSDDDKAAINLTVTEVQKHPNLDSVSANVNGTVANFTVKGNADAKYGIVLYADGYKLDMISWSKSGSTTYTGSHTFNQTGERKITVYALDENGDEVSDSKVTTTINIDSLGKSGTPTITTSNNQKIEVGSSFTISWNAPTTPTGVTFKYNVYLWDGKTNTLIGENLSKTSYTIAANKLGKVGTYTISVIAMATDYTQSGEASINVNVIEKEAIVKVTLNTPRVSGSSKIQYGDDYTISWDFDAQVDYYQITIDGLNYKKAVNATEKSFTIPGSVFKQYSGADTNYTISLVAMSHDTEKYLPSEAATIRVNVAGYSESNALIKSAEILDGNEIIAGTVVRFKIVTTKDVTALRMKDGAGTFIVNTWYASEIGTNSSNAQYYKDSGNERIWYVQQKVNHAGDANAAGAKRLLTFYSMVNEVEYNNCSVSFYCKKGNDVIGKFEITSPGNNAMLPSGKDIVVTWSAPTNTTVDYYIVDVYHGDVRVDRATVTATTYMLSGTLLEKDSVAWQIRVTARKDEGQWAESVATASFKLECMHEHLGQPTENILSYAQKNDTVHSCVVEKTYACLDCGLANAKKVQETVTKSHNWIALDKGGKVCNQCWHLQSDGSFTVKKDMQLSSLAGNRQFVYFNVDASGNPANKQNGRYVDKSDKITILGEVGNCYLIEYPITVNTRASGATNSGFIEQRYLSILIKLNDNLIYDGIYSEYDNKYYVPVDQAIGAFGGSFRWTSNESFTITITNSLDGKDYTATVDLTGKAGSNVDFSENGTKKYILWASKRGNCDVLIELDKLARLVCGALKVTDTEYVIKDESALQAKISELCEYFNVVATYDFPYDNTYYKILLQGGISAVVHEAENVVDVASGEMKGGDEIVQQIVLQMLSAKESEFLDGVVDLYEWNKDLTGVYDYLAKDMVNQTQFKKLFDKIKGMSTEDFQKAFVFNAKYDSDDIVSARLTSDELQKLLKEYGFEDVLDMQAIYNIRTLSQIGGAIENAGELMNIVSLIASPISDTVSHNKWLSDICENHYDEVVSELQMMLEVSNDVRMQRSLENMIRDIQNQHGAFNPFDGALYVIDNVDDVKDACDYVMKLGKAGFFGEGFKKIANEISNKAKVVSDSGVGKVAGGILAADQFLSLPSTIVSIFGADPSAVYQKLEQAETIGKSLSKQADDFNSLTYRDQGFKSQLTYCVYLSRTALKLFLDASQAEASIFNDNAENIAAIEKINTDFEIIVSEVYALLESSGY